MNRFSSKLIATGAVALLVGAFAPHSSARAQSIDDTCGLTIDSSDMLSLDKAQKTILCAIGAECEGVTCKEIAYKELFLCLENADSVVAKQLCDQTGLKDLQVCIANVTLKEAGCEINPTVPTAPAD